VVVRGDHAADIELGRISVARSTRRHHNPIKKGTLKKMNRQTKVLLAFFSLTIVGCGPSKVDQCNAFVDEGNKSQSAFVALQAALLNPTSLQTRIDKIDGSAKSLRAVKLADAKLIGMRDKYANGLEAYSKILVEMKPILNDEAKTDEFNKNIDKLNAISDDESKLIDEVNAYCSGG
jgi:hypothetical protein